MLKIFVELQPHYLSIEDAQRYDQRPFRGLLVKGWITYKGGKGFHITKAGKDAWREFQGTEIFRKNPAMPLTAYFDPSAYQLKKKVHVLPRAGAA